MQLLESSGKVVVNKSKERIVLDTSPEILDYYHWFIRRRFWIELQKPLHGSHITISFHKYNKDIDWQRASYYDGETLPFKYDVEVVRGGYTKGFIMFYLKVYSEELDAFKRDVGIIDDFGYKGLHLTLGNTKSGVRLWWPEMITIDKN